MMTAVLAGIVGVVSALVVLRLSTEQVPHQESQQEKIASYYEHEVATLVSPHHVRKAILNGERDFVLVDVRSYEEYEAEHIIGALSVPAYVDKENTQKTDKNRIIEAFGEIQREHPAKEIIVYCYSSACMTGRKIGNMLAQNGIYVHELGVGWNEWRYFWKQWNYPHEWDKINPEDYVSAGKEPGQFSAHEKELPSPCNVNNEFGC